MARIYKGDVVLVTPMGEARVVAQAVAAAEAKRIEAMKARGQVPPECGPEIPAAPARGAFKTFEVKALYPVGVDGYEAKPAGYRGRKAIKNLDVFDRMEVSARRAQKPMPLTTTQVAMARHYRDLHERHACAGMRGSSLEVVQGGGSGGGGEFIDAVLRDREELARLHKLIGDGHAMVVRRIRPSQRGKRVNISDRALVDMVCLGDRSVSEVLASSGWAERDTLRVKLLEMLSKALNRMTG